MTTSLLTLIDQAKQGDLKALTDLLNKKLNAKGIIAKASLKRKCLHILVESKQTPPEEPIVIFLRKALAKLEVESWKSIKVYGRKAGEEIPDWVTDLELSTVTEHSLEELAQSGNIDAISQLLNQQLQKNGVAVQISHKGDCLRMMLEAAESPIQDVVSELIEEEIKKLKIQGISTLKLYGKQQGEDFPDWQADIKLIESSLEDASLTQDSDLSSHEAQSSDLQDFESQIPSIRLSNRIYELSQTTGYRCILDRINSEDEKSVHKIAEDFLEDLEINLRADFEQFIEEALILAQKTGFSTDKSLPSKNIKDNIEPKLRCIYLKIKNLDKVTTEVLQADFPQETDAFKAFLKGAAHEFSSNLLGGSTSSTEAVIGATIGSLVAPGLGTVIGGAIGGWIGGNKKQKNLESILGKYQEARSTVLEEWEEIIQAAYAEVTTYLNSKCSLQIISYDSIKEANDAYRKGNELLDEGEHKSAYELYEKATQLNPGMMLAWNNIVYILNQSQQYELASEIAFHALKIDQTIDILFSNYGDSFHGVQKYEEALQCYEKALEIEPSNYLALLNKADCLDELGRVEEAWQASQKLIELDQYNFLGWYAKAACEVTMGQNLEAISSLEHVVELEPEKIHTLVKGEKHFEPLTKMNEFLILMESSLGIDYSSLKSHLSQRKWQQADVETAQIVQKILDLMNRRFDKLIDSDRHIEYIDSAKIEKIPQTDLATINRLWLESSDGKYGWSIQKSIFEFVSPRDINSFGEKVGWRAKDENNIDRWLNSKQLTYQLEDMPRGHLPSTLWAGQEDLWLEENRRDKLMKLFRALDACKVQPD